MSSTVRVGPPVSGPAESPIAPYDPGVQPSGPLEPFESGGVSPWAIIRRHAVLVVASAIAATIAASMITARTTPVYEATASVRIDERPSQPSALEGIGIAGSNVLATELEMLRSRQLVKEVADSLSLRLGVQQPRFASRDSIFSRIRIAPDAVPGPRRLIRTSDTTFVLLDAIGDTLDSRIPAGGHVEREGLAFDLAPSAWNLPSIDFEVLSADAAVDSLLGVIDVSRRNREADVVDVSVRDVDPALARDAANVLVRRFIAGRESSKQLEARSAVEFLRGQIDRVALQLAASEQKLRNFREGQRIVSLPDEASSGVTRRAELQAQRNTLEAERGALDRMLRTTRANAAPDDDGAAYRELLAFPTLVRSGMANDVLTALTAAEEHRAELLARRTNRDPDVVLVNARIAQLHASIRALVTTYLSGLTDQVAALDALLSQSDSKLQTIPGKEIRLGELERNAKGAEAVYSMLQNRLKEAEIAAASTDQTVRVVDAATLPRGPIYPRPLRNLALAMLVGVLLGISGAFLLERGDRSLHTRRELLAATGVPVLGIVPRLELSAGLPRLLGDIAARLGSGRSRAIGAVETRGTASARGSAGTPESLFVFTESLSRLATNLLFRAPGSRPRVLLVTSALRGDGKTTIATNLALSFVRSGQRVLLIDADLRGGRIGGALSLRHSPGLGEVLTDAVEASQSVQELPNLSKGQGVLHVITAGAVSDPPARLLTSNAATKLIAWSRSTYDMVIIDTPPVSSVADATLMAHLTDGVVVIARSGATPRDALAFALEQLRIVQAPVFGAVLNDVDLRRDPAYDGAYQTYGRYYASVSS
jgi:succinoglycan biosynthesis transport protein ExoP